MPRNIKIGLNPLPWVLTPVGFDLSVPILSGLPLARSLRRRSEQFRRTHQLA